MEENRLAGRPKGEILREGMQIAADVKQEMRKVLFGKEIEPLIDLLIIALFADAHIISKALIGVGKTLACTCLANAVGGTFRRKGFIPDLTPQMLIGWEFFNEETGKYEYRPGPVYGVNIFLADEINRAVPKAQAALLDVMEDRFFTVGCETYHTPPVFMVLATRNPVELEGTFPLPEAQLDRFFAQVEISFPSEETGLQILQAEDWYKSPSEKAKAVHAVTNPAEILTLREEIIFAPKAAHAVHIDEEIERYCWRLIAETWKHKALRCGSSPRGAINLKRAAMIIALLEGESYIRPEFVQRYAEEILAHRIFMTPEARFAEDREIEPRDIIREIVKKVPYK